jgi:amino acid transporter
MNARQEGSVRTMVDTRIILAALWGCLMLVFLLGDVLRIYAGDFATGELAGRPAPPWMWLLIAVIMLTPIVMIALSLVVPYPRSDGSAWSRRRSGSPSISWVCRTRARMTTSR